MTPLELTRKLLSEREDKTPAQRRRLRQIESFLLGCYFKDKRGYEMRKFLWVYKKVKHRDAFFSRIPPVVAMGITECL